MKVGHEDAPRQDAFCDESSLRWGQNDLFIALMDTIISIPDRIEAEFS
jgi:hypothetical protein